MPIEKKRCFLALLPDAKLHMQLFEQMQRLRIRMPEQQPGQQLRWTRPEQLHLTLNFLGDLSEQQIERLSTMLSEQQSTKHSAPLCQLTVIDVFPNPAQPRVIAAIGSATEALLDLVRRCQLPGEKPVSNFCPHITLARYRKGQTPSGFISQPLMLEMKASEIFLIESTLTAQGPIYTELARFRV